MLIEIVGWTSTLLVLGGYGFNSINRRKQAFTTWILGDLFFIIYDVFIANWSHLALSAIIIAMNVWGMVQIYKNTLKDSSGS